MIAALLLALLAGAVALVTVVELVHDSRARRRWQAREDAELRRLQALARTVERDSRSALRMVKGGRSR